VSKKSCMEFKDELSMSSSSSWICFVSNWTQVFENGNGPFDYHLLHFLLYQTCCCGNVSLTLWLPGKKSKWYMLYVPVSSCLCFFPQCACCTTLCTKNNRTCVIDTHTCMSYPSTTGEEFPSICGGHSTIFSSKISLCLGSPLAFITLPKAHRWGVFRV
jgi:hypothetical protein